MVPALIRSFLYAPGHDEKLLAKVFEVEADAVILDLEDAVPPELRDRARLLVREVLADRPAWVRVNRSGTEECAADLDSVAHLALGIKVPKVEAAADVRWVVERAKGAVVSCMIETARGLLAVSKIALEPGVSHLSFGAADFSLDTGADPGVLQTLFARSQLVVSSRAARLDPPVDSVYPHIRDDTGLRTEAEFARSLGFFGKCAVHPGQVSVINDVFTPSEAAIHQASLVLAAFDAAGGAACRLPDGQFVDGPIAERARRLIAVVERPR